MAFDWRRRQAELRAVIRQSVTPEDVAAVAEALIRRAAGGDQSAAAMLASYGGAEALWLRAERFVSEG